MPLPKPGGNEAKDDFLHRCMGEEVMVSEYLDEKQRYAVCNNLWSKGVEMTEQLIPIFKTGTHTDSQGRSASGARRILIRSRIRTIPPSMRPRS